MDPLPDATLGTRRAPTLLALLLAAAFAFKAYSALSLASRGVTFFIDDAFYYLLIARNFADTGVPTFDGVNPTNGFHPLWMLLLAAMYKVIGTGTDPFTQLVAAKALEMSALGGSLAACAFAFQRLHRRTPLAWGFAGAALVLLAPRLYLFDQGMESTLAAGLLLAALFAVIDRHRLLLAVVLPLLFLARLDSLVFVIAPLASWWIVRDRASLREHAATFAPVAITAAAFIALNLALTGHANTISGQIKSSFPSLTLHWSYLVEPLFTGPLFGWRVLYALPNAFVPTVVIAMLAIVATMRRREPWARPVAWILLMSALLVANVALFQRWDKGVDARYLSLPYVLLGFALFATVAALRVRAALAAFGALFLAIAAVLLLRHAEEKPLRMELTRVNEVKAKTAPGERFAGTDVGAFAFWLERPFVNLDGLVNNRALQDAIRDKRLADYLERQDVRYLLAAFWDREQALVAERPERMYRSRIFPEGVKGADYAHYDFDLYSYIHDAESDAIRLCPSEEIFREAIGRDGLANAAIVIYRLPRPVRRAAADARCPGR
ncbi:MAG TPA: hypothetical protein VEC19_13610 [Usitatibacter sp.]|nr:hypothetical protein [Usitatibacter sp.]